MLFKEFLIWVFWGQNVGPGWVKNGKKGFFYTSYLSANSVLSKTEVLNKQPSYPSTLSKLKYELTDLSEILQKFIFY